jgi:hypothetical protein
VAWGFLPDHIELQEAQLLGNVKKEHVAYLLQPQDKINSSKDKKTVEEADTDTNDGLHQRPGPTGYETPVVWAKQSHGYIGVIGDVNAQRETDVLILAMLGLVTNAG